MSHQYGGIKHPFDDKYGGRDAPVQDDFGKLVWEEYGKFSPEAWKEAQDEDYILNQVRKSKASY